MSLIELRLRIDQQYEHWIRVSKKVLEDAHVDCEEARQWLAWYAERQTELGLIRKEINLATRAIRTEYRVKIAGATVYGAKTRLREAQDVAIAPYAELLAKVERLLLEGEKVKPTLERLVREGC